jgi:ribosome-associated protein
MAGSDIKFPLSLGMLVNNMPEIKESFDKTNAELSKSQRRRDALELKSLARSLIDLSASRLDRMPLEQDLRDAVDQARRIRSNVARKRQMQFVAKLLRRADAEPIIEAMAALEQVDRQLTARQHRAERWRDYLLEAGDAGVSELLRIRRGADAQAIRQLIRNAHNEAARERPPAASRSLFRLLREMDEDEPLPLTKTQA